MINLINPHSFGVPVEYPEWRWIHAHTAGSAEEPRQVPAYWEYLFRGVKPDGTSLLIKGDNLEVCRDQMYTILSEYLKKARKPKDKTFYQTILDHWNEINGLLDPDRIGVEVVLEEENEQGYIG